MGVWGFCCDGGLGLGWRGANEMKMRNEDEGIYTFLLLGFFPCLGTGMVKGVVHIWGLFLPCCISGVFFLLPLF